MAAGRMSCTAAAREPMSWPAGGDGGVAPGANRDRLRIAASLEEAIADAEVDHLRRGILWHRSARQCSGNHSGSGIYVADLVYTVEE